MKEALDGLKGQGKKIVFTNGCFDLIHAGHVRYLKDARGLGDCLVVGLNSDSSVRKIKGQKRPLIPEGERAYVLAAFGCVDFVTIFSEETPLELIRFLKPQVLVKGGDWFPDQVVGREEVESWGGRVVIVPYVAGLSTTNIIERIKEAYL